MAVVVLFIITVLFIVLMGRRRSYNPRDYQGYDVENAPRHVSASSSSSEDSSGSRRHRRRRRTQSHSHSPDAPPEPKFRIICPYRSCERHQKRHSRLYSTVRRHLRHHLMGEKFKVIFYLIPRLYPLVPSRFYVKSMIYAVVFRDVEKCQIQKLLW
jgi:hypothetical protein